MERAARQLSAPLLVAILCVPLLFGLIVLRRGYPRSLRVAVFTYAGVVTLVGAIGRLG